jgi:hypothetical protein
MKIILACIVCIFLVVGAYVLGSFNASKTIALPPAEWAEGNDAAKAWRQFVASMEAAGARVFTTSQDPQERLDGLAYLAQITSVSLEMKLAKGSKLEPRFTNWMADYRKFLGDSPDAIYHTAELSSGYSYEITGNIADAEYLGFMLYGTSLNGWNRAANNISNETLRFDSSGNFRIILSKDKPADSNVDWLPLEDDVHMVMVRQYYHGRTDKQEANFTIHNLAPQTFVPATEKDIAAGLSNATSFFNGTVDGAFALADVLAAGANNIDHPKSYNPDFGGVFYPTLDNDYYGSWFYLEDDEALIVEGTIPDAPYWSISLQNRWMQSLDYEHYPVALNDAEIEVENRRYRVIVSQQKPSSGNWLSTAGKRQGLLSIRYQQSKTSEKPSLRVVKFNQL